MYKNITIPTCDFYAINFVNLDTMGRKLYIIQLNSLCLFYFYLRNIKKCLLFNVSKIFCDIYDFIKQILEISA